MPRTADPAADLLALGLAYRASALADPAVHRVVFEVAGAGARAPHADATVHQPRSQALLDAVRRVRTTGSEDGGAGDVKGALALWALVHGATALELAGLAPGDDRARERRFAALLRAAGPAIVSGVGARVVPAGAAGSPDGARTSTPEPATSPGRPAP